MKTTNTRTIEAREKTKEIDLLAIVRFLVIVLIMSTSIILLYKNFYLWSIGIIFVSMALLGIYRLYKEINSYDWSIHVSDLTMEEAVSDLERISQNHEKDQS